MIGSGMIAVGAWWQHRHRRCHRRHGALVAPFGTMQRRALRSLGAAAARTGNGSLPRFAAVTAVVAVVIPPIASIPRRGSAFGGLVRTAAFLVIRGKVFIILHPSDDFFTVRQRLWSATLTAIGIGRRRCATDVHARNAGIYAGASGIRGMHGQARLGSSSHHIHVVRRRGRTLRTEGRHISRRGIEHLEPLIASLIFKVRQLRLLEGGVMRMPRRRISADVKTGLHGLR